MANTVKIKRSSVEGKNPTTSDLELGELALNTYDGNLFFKKNVLGVEEVIKVSTVDNLLSYNHVISNTTAVSRQSYIADTSDGAFTITLPSNPTTGDWVTIVDGASFSTTALTIDRNSSTIADIEENLSLNIEGVSVTLVYDGSTWEVYTQVGANGGDQAGLVTGASTTTFTNKTISGSTNTLSNIANASLTNSSITVNGTSVSLGGSVTVSSVSGNAGTVTNGVYTTDTGSVTNTMLANSSISINGSAISLGGSVSSLVTLTGTETLTNKTLTTPVVDRLDWAGSGTGAPAFTTRSSGTKLLLYPAISGSQVDYAMGINSATLWSSVPVNSSDFYFKWYGGETQVASLSGNGNLTVAGSISVPGAASVTANSATDKYINVGTHGQLFDDGNFHIHSSDGALWLNSLNGSDINIGLQSNSGASKLQTNNISMDAGYGTRAPIYGVRAWISCGYIGSTMVTNGSGNLSVSRVAAGKYAFTFGTAMPDGNYSVTATAKTPFDDSDVAANLGYNIATTTTGFTIHCARYGTGYLDVPQLCVQVVR